MSAPADSLSVPVRDDSQIGDARRATRRLALQLGLDDLLVERAAIIATEAARNAATHGGGGELVMRGLGGGGLEVLALDRGPGIPDVARALRDGYSTAGTAGQGLGAISRLATDFDVYSATGQGTAVLARVGEAGEDADLGAVCVAVASERESGDAWAVVRGPGRTTFLVVDGLGHGHHAAEAARAAVRSFLQHAGGAVTAVVEAMHAALRATRGAALGVAEVVPGSHVRFAGIGNIAASVVGSERARKLASLPGTAGHQIRRVQQFEHPWPDAAVLVMHSDGVATHWDLDDYPGLVTRHPALVAGVLYRDFGRGRDDATVLVARKRPA